MKNLLCLISLTSRATTILVSFVTLITFSSLAGCGKKDESAPEVAPLEVEVVKVTGQDVPLSVEFVGEIAGSIDAEIRARVEGVVTGMSFQEGSEVQEGQLLYTIDAQPYEAKVAEALGKLSEATTSLAKAESDLKRVKPLVEMKALSARDLDAAVAQQGVAKGAVEAATAALESAKIQLGYCKIYAPTRGVIGLSKAKIGEFVGRAPNPIVLNTVSNIDPVHVRFSVNEREYLYFSRLKIKQAEEGKEAGKRVLELYLADGSKHTEPGEVASVDRQIDKATGSLMIEASFPNPHKLLRPGQFAKVKTISETLSGALMVPVRAIRELQGQYQIFVVKDDGVVEQRTVTTGAVSGGLQVIESGLKSGETVVVEGLQRLKNGVKVKPRVTQ